MNPGLSDSRAVPWAAVHCSLQGRKAKGSQRPAPVASPPRIPSRVHSALARRVSLRIAASSHQHAGITIGNGPFSPAGSAGRLTPWEIVFRISLPFTTKLLCGVFVHLASNSQREKVNPEIKAPGPERGLDREQAVVGRSPSLRWRWSTVAGSVSVGDTGLEGGTSVFWKQVALPPLACLSPHSSLPCLPCSWERRKPQSLLLAGSVGGNACCFKAM